MEQIRHYFPDLSEVQYEQLGKLQALYEEWNAQINVISRKDMENFYERHVLHSLAYAKVIQFMPGTRLLDIGTGGGFPGIPLAVLFPEAHFHLVDSIGKKIKVVNEVSAALGLKNVQGEHARAEKIKGQYDFIISRAVTRMANFLPWTRGKFLKENKHSIPNGILYLKGGYLKEELSEINRKYKMHALAEHFSEEFFETKYLIEIPFSGK